MVIPFMTQEVRRRDNVPVDKNHTFWDYMRSDMLGGAQCPTERRENSTGDTKGLTNCSLSNTYKHTQSPRSMTLYAI